MKNTTHRRITAFLCGLVASLGMAASASAAMATFVDDDYTASTPGWSVTHFDSIPDAVAATDPGGSVTVLEGSYTLNARLDLDQEVTLAGADPESRPLVTINDQYYVNIAADNVTIENLHFEKPNTSSWWGDDSKSEAMFVVNRGGSWPTFTIDYTGVTIRNCIIDGSRRGAYLTADSITIEGNEFRGQSRDALYFNGGSGNIVVRYNTFRGGSSKAVLVEHFSSADPGLTGTFTLSGNAATGKTNFFVYSNWQPVADDALDLNIIHNTVSRMNSNAIAVFFPATDGFDRFSRIQVRDNIFSYTGSGTRPAFVVDYQYGGAGIPGAGAFDIVNNLTFQNGIESGGLGDPSGNFGYTPGYPAGATLAAFNLVDNIDNTDPKYTDPLHLDDDYTLQSDSPAIGAASDGTTIGAWQAGPQDPWQNGLTAGEILSADFGSQTTAGCVGGGSLEIAFYDADNDVLLGSLDCAGTFTTTGAGTSSGGQLLLEVTASNAGDVPDFAIGDHLEFTTPEGTYRAYLPANEDNLYGTRLTLWVDTVGSTYFACTEADRACAQDSADSQSIVDAGEAGDYAQRAGSTTVSLVATAGSDYNWVGLTHLTSETATAQALYNAFNAEAGAPTLVRTVARWNPISQAFSQFVAFPFVSGNFDLALGEPYRIEVDRTTDVTLVGAEPNPGSLTFDLVKTQSTGVNYLTLPWYKADLENASDLYDDINLAAGTTVVTTISTWNPTSQSFTQYIPTLGGDFPLSTGTAYRVEVNASASYTPVAP